MKKMLRGEAEHNPLDFTWKLMQKKYFSISRDIMFMFLTALLFILGYTRGTSKCIQVSW
jgi:hypothetical protein